MDVDRERKRVEAMAIGGGARSKSAKLVELLRRFLSIQQRRAETYAKLRRGFLEYMIDKAELAYQQLCGEITVEFQKKLSIVGMGQVMGALCEKIKGTEWRKEQKKKIIDIAFETLKMETAEAPGSDHMEFDKLYIAVLRIYNEMNKILPGNHTDPPTKEELKKSMAEFDVNLDGLLDRDEFEEFIKKISTDTATLFTTKLMITLVLAPTAALLTKKTTEDVPGVGKAVQKIPTSVYTTIFTFLVVWFQSP